MKEKKSEKACPLVAKQGKVKVLEMRSGFLHASTLLRNCRIILYLRLLYLRLLYFTVFYFILQYLPYKLVF